MKPLIVANWKMNPQTLAEAKQLFNSVKKGIKNIRKVEVVICPPFIYLPILTGASTSARRKASFGRRCSIALATERGLAFGSQDCFWEKEGAYTGEISPIMLKNLGCQYVIIGHSERRRYFVETDETINKKLKAVLAAKLNPILCIGETQAEKEQGKTETILENQILSDLENISSSKFSRVIITYEPIWAIGTGKPCDVEEAQKIGLLIRKIIYKKYSGTLAKNLNILYGGSVNKENAKSYIKESGLNGLLVGGASLKANEFIGILKAVKI